MYAYVVGFIGNSTNNEGTTINTLSIDQFTASNNPVSIPVNVYVRNQGPSTEGFNTGFYVKSSSMDDQLAIGFALLSSSSNSLTALTIGSASSTGELHITLTCTGTSTVTITSFGVSGTVSCSTTQRTTNLPSTGKISGVTLTNSTSHGMLGTLTFGAGLSLSTNANSPTIVGVPIAQGGTINLAIGNVIDFQLALPMTNGTTIASSNPLTVGQTYTVQVTGTDGAYTTAPARAT